MKSLFAMCCLALLSTSSTAFAADEVITITKSTATSHNGWYSGMSLGGAKADRESVVLDESPYRPYSRSKRHAPRSHTEVSTERELGFRIYGGKIYYDDEGVGLGFELGYASLSENVTAVDLTAIFTFPNPFIQNLPFHIRGGYASWDADVGQSDQDVILAAGISKVYGDLVIRGEYSQYQDINIGGREQNLPFITIGGYHKF